MEHSFSVAAQEAGDRLDKWLCTKLPGFSRRQLKNLLDGGRVVINGRRVLIAGWELEPEDTVEIRIPPGFEKEEATAVDAGDTPPAEAPRGAERPRHHPGHPGVRASIDRHFARQHQRRREASEEARRAKETPAQKLLARLKIYAEDRDIIVVEKPAGVLSVPNEKNERQKDCLLSAVHNYIRRKHKGGKGSFVAPLHRLDAETSGLMVFALSRNGQKLEQQFRSHAIRREYTAIVAGRIEEEQGIIDLPLEKGDFGGGKKVQAVEVGGEGGKRAVTEYTVKERYKNATLLEIRVRTGRTHQIRVHLAHKGFPLVGDKLYSDDLPEGSPDHDRHALHAHTLGFRHPVNGKKVNYHSSLPKDLRELIDKLRGTV